jgi:hypothetical protein
LLQPNAFLEAIARVTLASGDLERGGGGTSLASTLAFREGKGRQD